MTQELGWQKSSFSSSGNNCIELARTPNGIAMRESDEPGVVIATTRPRLDAFLAAVKAGKLDRPAP
jgi:hypothetical protein